MARSTLNSKLFWELMDRWKVDDVKALQLIGHHGALTKKGTRPRFALGSGETRRATNLVALERQLLDLQRSPAAWLKRKNKTDPFKGQKPIDYMIIGGSDAIDATRRFVEKMALRASL